MIMIMIRIFFLVVNVLTISRCTKCSLNTPITPKSFHVLKRVDLRVNIKM